MEKYIRIPNASFFNLNSDGAPLMNNGDSICGSRHNFWIKSVISRELNLNHDGFLRSLLQVSTTKYHSTPCNLSSKDLQNGYNELLSNNHASSAGRFLTSYACLVSQQLIAYLFDLRLLDHRTTKWAADEQQAASCDQPEAIESLWDKQMEVERS